MSNLVSISSTALYTAFVLYLIATLFFGATFRDKRTADMSKKSISGVIGITLTIIGYLSYVVYFIFRWITCCHNLVSISSTALYTYFVLYLIATLFFGATIRDKRTADMSKKSISGVIGITLTIIGFLAQVVYFISRWIAGGHAPVSNMFEFVTFL